MPPAFILSQDQTLHCEKSEFDSFLITVLTTSQSGDGKRPLLCCVLCLVILRCLVSKEPSPNGARMITIHRFSRFASPFPEKVGRVGGGTVWDEVGRVAGGGGRKASVRPYSSCFVPLRPTSYSSYRGLLEIQEISHRIQFAVLLGAVQFIGGLFVFI